MINSNSANPADEEESKPASQKYLTFVLSDKTYAFSIAHVKEIIEYGLITTIPKMPSFICGAINIRGRVVPVVDLVLRLTDQPGVISNRSCILIIECFHEGKPFKIGVVVDSVSEVIDLSSEDVVAPPEFGDIINTDFIEAMGKSGDEFIIILDISFILSMNDLAELVSGKKNS